MRFMKIIISSMLLALTILAHDALSYHTNVHATISENAFNKSVLGAGYLQNLGIAPNDKFNELTPLELIQMGSVKEDDSLTLRWLNHFYEPTTGQGLHIGPATLGDPSLQWAKTSTDNEWVWWIARLDYYRALTNADSTERNNHFALLFRGLGHIIHLVHDLAVPSHVRNDPHNAPYIGLPYDMYESYTRDNITSLTYSGYPTVDIGVFNNFDKFWINSGDGLAEYTNANFYSKKTFTTSDYPNPAPENTNYYADLSLLPITITTTPDNVNHNTFYVSGYGKEHLAALKYFTEEIFATASPSPLVKYKLSLFLDNRCHEEYAQYLVPRAVGYSAGLLNYFFRGTLDVIMPDRIVYGIADGSIVPQQFTTIKANVKNTTPNEAMGAGTLVAFAKYKKRIGYQPDLSADPPTAESREANFSYSVSAPITITSLPTLTEFTFDFAQSPIPAGITDLYLFVVFKGTLGSETDTAVAVGMEDLYEPLHITVWNSTDRFYLDNVLRTREEILNDPALLSRVDHNGDGSPDERINRYSVTTDLAFAIGPVWAEPYQVSYYSMPHGGYGRLLLLADTEFWIHARRETSDIVAHSLYMVYDGVVNAEYGGAFYSEPVYSFRGILQHGWISYAEYYPDNTDIWLAPWPTASGTTPSPIGFIRQ